MGESKLTDLDIEFYDGTKISMKKSNTNNVICSAPMAETTATITSNVTIEAEIESNNKKIIKSPMVGTANPYVLEGDKITEGQTLCIIEAMKLMNEIESDYTGVITKILAKDGEMVEYGQPLFEIE